MQKFVKKGKSSRSRDDRKEKSKNPPINEDKSYNRPQSAIGEIKTNTEGPFTSGSFKSLKKSQQTLVNSVYEIHPLNQRRRTSMDILFLEEDARGMKQPDDNPLVIMLMIEGFNTSRILVYNGNSTEIIYLSAFQQLRWILRGCDHLNLPLSVSAKTGYTPEK